jgi:hypothetical protein
VITVALTTKEEEVKSGLEFVLGHLDGLWPRTISTYATKGGQRKILRKQWHISKPQDSLTLA